MPVISLQDGLLHRRLTAQTLLRQHTIISHHAFYGFFRYLPASVGQEVFANPDSHGGRTAKRLLTILLLSTVVIAALAASIGISGERPVIVFLVFRELHYACMQNMRVMEITRVPLYAMCAHEGCSKFSLVGFT